MPLSGSFDDMLLLSYKRGDIARPGNKGSLATGKFMMVIQVKSYLGELF